MQFAPGGFGARGDLCVPRATFWGYISVLRLCLEQKHALGACSGTNFALEKRLKKSIIFVLTLA